MRISMKSDYALRAMMELAAAYGKGPLQSADIAARRSIPEAYLEQLLTVLRKSGLINSTRGPQGGHALAKPPSEITPRDIVRAMEGPVVAIDALDSHGAQIGTGTVLRDLWLEVRSAVEATLGGVTLEELLTRELSREGWVMYHI